ncbi:MAG: hypothetical protein QXR60_00715 [Candidatus Nanoarchaeia archaeon]
MKKGLSLLVLPMLVFIVFSTNSYALTCEWDIGNFDGTYTTNSISVSGVSGSCVARCTGGSDGKGCYNSKTCVSSGDTISCYTWGGPATGCTVNYVTCSRKPCYDSDTANDIYYKGYVNYYDTYYRQRRDVYDACASSTSVREYYCVGPETIASTDKSCSPGTCSNGVCVCSNECSSGQKRCYSGGVQTCGQYDADSCLDWGGYTACGSCQSCSSGSCYNTCQATSTSCGCTSCTNCDTSGTGGGRTGDGCVGTTYVDYYCSGFGGSCIYNTYTNDARCPPSEITIYGYIKTGNVGISDVYVSADEVTQTGSCFISPHVSRFATTSSTGYYSFTFPSGYLLAPCDWILITPSKSGCTFSPSEVRRQNTGSNIQQDFAGTCCIPNCVGKCGGASDGCGGTCTAACPSPQVCYNQACCTPATCSSLGKQCGSWLNGCGGTLNCGTCSSGYVCNSNGQCVLGTEVCTTAGDENNNGQCDYDSSICSKGDPACPVEITSISVSNPNPIADSSITVTCTSSVPNVNSIVATIDIRKCQFNYWSGPNAVFSCVVGSSTGSKTVRCTIDITKSSQNGTDKTTTVNVLPSTCSAYTSQNSCEADSRCDWCPECVGVMFTGNVDRCVDANTCPTPYCWKGKCGATCDPTQGGCLISCDALGCPPPQECNTTTCSCQRPCIPCSNTCYNLTATQTCVGGCLDRINYCSPGQICYNNVCCTPATCSSLGKQCGSWSDGCGGTLNCGTCTPPQTCNSTGQCSLNCTSQCASSGAKQCSSSTSYQICGDANGDGCFEWGSSLDCGTGYICSGGNCVLGTEVCTTAGDENNNNECDYDSSICSKGDVACPVGITSISVSTTTPTEGSGIKVNCTSNVANVNSIDAGIDGLGVCSFDSWVGNIALFSCNNLGSPGSKTVRCAVNTARSYKDGTDKTTTITVQSTPCSAYTTESSCPSETCDWCPECVGAKYTGDVGRCVSDGSCPAAICSKGHCGATCDETTGGCTSPSTCDESTCSCSSITQEETHLECGVNGQCVQVTGAGANVSGCSSVGQECSVPESNHAECIGNMCVLRPGDVTDKCGSNTDCQGTPCQNGQCDDNFVCDSVNNICVCPDGTSLCNDNTCDTDCSDNGGSKGCSATTCKVNSSCINGICQPCILYAAAWMGGNVTNCDGDVCAVANDSFVELYANGTDACENKKFKFRVFEDQKTNVKAYPPSSIFDDGEVKSDWIAASEDSSTASYKFYVRGVGMEDKISTNTITVCMEDDKPDSDCDGVPDDKDIQCPNTPYGEKVDSNGCTPQQAECSAFIDCTDVLWSSCDENNMRTRDVCQPGRYSDDCCADLDPATCKCTVKEGMGTVPDYCKGTFTALILTRSPCLVEEEFPFFTAINVLMVVSLLIIFYFFRFRKR